LSNISQAAALSLREVVDKQSLHEHFADLGQQREAAKLGMWVFLATEVMFFGGMITGYVAYRDAYPAAFQAGSVHMLFVAGTLNTALLITASLFVALAVHAAREGRRKLLVLFLAISMFLGVCFLAVKGYEYYQHYLDHKVPTRSFQWDGPDPRHAEMFFVLYFFLTGFHALHMVIGVSLLGFIIYFAHKGRYTPEYYNPVENAALYWHFVDIVWIFLYPMLYLVGHTHV
jgi:cytochrome c oxidase subunit III